MSLAYFSSPSFFIVLVITIIPAAILGIMERNIKYYGFIVSCFFIFCLFADSLNILIYVFFFLFYQSTITYMFYKHRSKHGKISYLFYITCLFSALPLLIYKIGVLFNSSTIGFIGLSYITFRSLQVIIEIQDGIIKKIDILSYLYFLIFFSSFISGPIDRSRRFELDISNIPSRNEYLQMLSTGILFILQGLVYKFVLSAVFLYWHQTFSISETVWQTSIVIRTGYRMLRFGYFYGFYLFFDFAGYSFMAIGTAYCFAIKMPANFKIPFISLDIKDFWNRWHITLSFWLRDYVFTRFMMFSFKRQIFKSNITAANTGYILNMLLMGLWHGLSANYIFYGIYHGILLAITDTYQKKSSF